MTDIICPHCQEVQSDHHNGGDPGDWWSSQYIPDGDCEHDCDSCGEEFIIRVNWSPSFEGMTLEDAE